VDWSLYGCARKGHVTYAPDESALRERLMAQTADGTAWRCLRCGAFVTGAQQHGSGPAAAAPQVRRGTEIRSQLILRVFAVERFLRFLVFAAAAYGVWRFRYDQASIERAYNNDLPAIRTLYRDLGFDVNHSRLLGLINKSLMLTPRTLTFLAIGLAAYALIELVESTGLWLGRRWGEYFAMVATSIFLPYEVYDLTVKVTWLRVVAFVINLLLVVYLVWTRRLFGVRGGKKAYEARWRGESVIEEEEAALAEQATHLAEQAAPGAEPPAGPAPEPPAGTAPAPPAGTAAVLQAGPAAAPSAGTAPAPTRSTAPAPEAAPSARPDAAERTPPQPRLGAGGPGGDDPADGPLEGVARAARLPLDLRVGFRHGAQRTGDALRLPAAQLLPDPVDLPRRGANLGREGGGVQAARRGTDPAEQPNPLRERAADQHGRDAGGQRPAQLLERLREMPLHGTVGDAEPGRLGTAPEVRGHQGLVDVVARVGGELVAGRRELAQVRADRVEQRPGGGIVGPLARPAKLRPDEVQPLGEPGDLRAFDDLRPGGLDAGQQFLSLGAARMGQDEGHVLRRAGPVPDQLGCYFLGHVLRGPDHQHATAAEQRRRGQRVQLARPKRRPVKVVDVTGQAGFLAGGHQVLDGAVDEELLLAHDDRYRGHGGVAVAGGWAEVRAAMTAACHAGGASAESVAAVGQAQSGRLR
jgi:uncharacterized membrane protein (DUF2068 family)